jgi:hypothetical protein
MGRDPGRGKSALDAGGGTFRWMLRQKRPQVIDSTRILAASGTEVFAPIRTIWYHLIPSGAASSSPESRLELPMFAEPKHFSPNSYAPVVNGIDLPSPALASQDIPNSTMHFRASALSGYRRGEPRKLVREVRRGPSSPVFSVSPENDPAWLTGLSSRFTLFELFAYVYSEG